MKYTSDYVKAHEGETVNDLPLEDIVEMISVITLVGMLEGGGKLRELAADFLLTPLIRALQLRTTADEYISFLLQSSAEKSLSPNLERAVREAHARTQKAHADKH